MSIWRRSPQWGAIDGRGDRPSLTVVGIFFLSHHACSRWDNGFIVIAGSKALKLFPMDQHPTADLLELQPFVGNQVVERTDRNPKLEGGFLPGVEQTGRNLRCRHFAYSIDSRENWPCQRTRPTGASSARLAWKTSSLVSRKTLNLGTVGHQPWQPNQWHCPHDLAALRISTFVASFPQQKITRATSIAVARE
jgi:hypothetical protein